jgi:hypothetical protein
MPQNIGCKNKRSGKALFVPACLRAEPPPTAAADRALCRFEHGRSGGGGATGPAAAAGGG